MKARLLNITDLAPEVRQMDFEVPSVAEFKFTPGQFISVVEHAEGKEKTRAYSIASPPDGNRFTLCLNRVPDGAVSNRLFQLHPGDEIDIQEPLGYFTLRHPARRNIFVCTGTGIAPFHSMLQSHLPYALLFGTRHESGLLYRHELEQLDHANESFRYMPTLTRPDETWQGRTGRVQTHLDDALGVSLNIPETDVYICGLKEMVDDVRTELKRRGFDRKQIIYEKYD